MFDHRRRRSAPRPRPLRPALTLLPPLRLYRSLPFPPRRALRCQVLGRAGERQCLQERARAAQEVRQAQAVGGDWQTRYKLEAEEGLQKIEGYIVCPVAREQFSTCFLRSFGAVHQNAKHVTVGKASRRWTHGAVVARVEQAALLTERTPADLSEAGSPMGIKRGSSEMYFVFSALWF